MLLILRKLKRFSFFVAHAKGHAPCACGAEGLRDGGSIRQCAHGVCRVTPTAGIRLEQEIQSHVGLGPEWETTH